MISPRLPLLFAISLLASAQAPLRNHRYVVELSGTSIAIRADGVVRTFRPSFLVQRADANPALELRWGKFGGREVQYNVSTWKVAGRSAAAASTVATGHIADGFNPLADRAAEADRTANVFAAAPGVAIEATKATVANQRIEWTFPPQSGPAQPGFEFAASLELPPGDAEPLLQFRLTPQRDGWYSVAYTGAPQTPASGIDEIWQPLIWQEKRFPNQAFLTEAFRCPLPGTMVTEHGVTTSVIADPVELPFQPLPTMQNSRFGIAVRNATGEAQSTLFAPILGGPGSRMTAGKPFGFRLRLAVKRGGILDAYRHLALGLYQVHDTRRNSAVNLNRTLENMIDYAMGSYARFNDELRGSAYDTDVPGSVKNISALHPLGIALATDNEEIFLKRARPMIEYGMSRERFLFSNDPNVKGQGASSKLDGPNAPVSEIAALYSMTGKRDPFLLDTAAKLVTRKRSLNLDAELDGGWWANALAMYRATGDRAWLAKARTGADAYIARRIARKQTDFNDPDSRGMFFWSSYAPQWADLYELWQETRDTRYRDAALYGAREYLEFIWMAPVVPDGEVRVNEGGRAPIYRNSKALQPIAIPEENAPAWRLSEIGLTPESSGTSKGHRGIFLASYAPFFLRLGEEGKDELLRIIGRSAVVGRYTTFPGYHINTARTTVYEKPDFPLRPMSQLNSTTSIHYNHIWAQIAMVFDFLVSDVAARTHGQVDFPSQFAEGYGYVTSKVYGDRPGRFLTDHDAWLWMPKGLVDTGNVQVNYLAARGKGKLYLALTNQSQEPVTTTIRINPELVTVKNPTIEVTIPASGILCRTLDDVRIQPRFQQKFAAPSPAWKIDNVQLRTGGTHALLLNAGPEYRSAYVYLQANSNELASATLRYSTGGEWKEVRDDSFPYEYTIPLDAQATRFRFRIEIKRKDGTSEVSDEAVLSRND